MSSSSASAGKEFQTFTRNDDKDSIAKEEPVDVQSVEEKKSVTLTSTDNKYSTVKELVDVQSAVETTESNIKESVVVQSKEEKFLTSTSKDGKDYSLKKSTGAEFLASTSNKPVVVQSVIRDDLLTLRSRDDQEFSVKKSVAFKSLKIKTMARHGSASSAIHLPRVDGRILSIVLEYLNLKYSDSEASAEDKGKYELEELVKKTLGDLIDVLCAFEYLEIKDSHEIFYKAARENIKNIELPEFPPLPDIENDPTLEEDEEHIRTEYPSDFDD